MIIRHYYNFGKDFNNKIKEGMTQDAWEMLRMDSGSKDFGFIEEDREAYVRMCIDNTRCRDMAYEVLNILDSNSIANKVISLGCGKGILEWNLKNIKPELVLECADYTPKSVEYLGKMFPECDKIYVFDMLESEHYSKKMDGNEVVLLYRVSTEFNFKTWESIFSKMSQSGVEHIVFIPTELCNMRIGFNEIMRYIYNLARGEGKIRNVFCGYMYSKRIFKKMWKKYFDVKETKKIGNTMIFLLCKKS